VVKVQSQDFNHLTNDLYTEIRRGNYPKWDLHVKVLSPEQLHKLDYNGLDATKVWLDVPDMKVGTMTLNRIPENFFLETEQSAFAPSNLIPGIEPSEDRLLQGRLFAYADTQLHRLSANLFQLPVNKPLVTVNNHNQNGLSNNAIKANGDVNYEPSRQLDLSEDAQFKALQTPLSGTVLQKAISNPRDYYQAGVFYRSMSAQDKSDLIVNLAGDLNKVIDKDIKETMVSFFYRADKDYGTRLAKATNIDLNSVKNKAMM